MNYQIIIRNEEGQEIVKSVNDSFFIHNDKKIIGEFIVAMQGIVDAKQDNF